MADGTLNEDLFRLTISGLIAQARVSVNNANVRIFGEMVSQSRSANLNATTRLEELWNDVIDDYSVSLLCTYALTDLEDHLPQCLIALHSADIEREKSAVS